MASSMIFERDVEIPMRDGEPLRANVYRPVGEGSFPVVMSHGPYGKDRHWADRNQQHSRDLGGGPFVNWETPDPETWVPKGYVVVRVDGRGSGASPGRLAPFSRTASENYYDAIEWAAAQPWSTGKVGLLGISFYAMTQWQVATLRPPHLAAMIPWEGASDVYRDFMRTGGILKNGFLNGWWPMTVLNVQHGWDGSLTAEERAANTTVSMNAEAGGRPFADEFYTSWGEDLAAIEVPFLSVGNWGNLALHLRGNVEAFLAASSPQKWLRIVVGDHIHPFYEPAGLSVQERFFDHFLKGEDNGWLDEPRVMLSIRDGDKTTWREASDWPLPQTRWTETYLDFGSWTLAETAAEANEQISYETMKDTVTLTTAPADHEVEITGPIALRLWASSSTTDLDIFVRLGRVDADGEEVLGVGPVGEPAPLAQGYLRASHRKLDADRSRPYRPFHTHDEATPLVPGEPVALDVEIWPTSIVLPVGSRLVLEIGGKELGHSHWTRDDAVDRCADVFDSTVTLYSGPSMPSALLLPLIPG